ncbi:MAG TPA: SLBB domain-containing protein, partial [Pyrinomonadaceae bacterium]|nr:SLBB domain-containing protein [Pyrinomonadaceae bacterium]
SSIKAANHAANPIIYPGDLVIVQKAAPIYITGEVRQPQGLYLRERGTSLREAIAQIGGINRTAKTKDIKIYRLKADSREREVISVNYDQILKGQQKDVMLEPYDIIEVDKAKESIAQTILKIATGSLTTGLSGITGGLGPAILY